MSQELISRSTDLKRLRDDGYDIDVTSGYLLVRQVPYVNAQSDVMRGVLVSVLTLANNVTTTPDNHVMLFSGDYPCNKDGSPIAQIENSSHPKKVIADGVTVDHTFSAKPAAGSYVDYYEKVSTYVRILSGPAEALDASATARKFPVVRDDDEKSIFRYIDTASSRAEIVMVNKKLELAKVAIIGLGGTGSYVLDLVAKTPVAEIALFDGDRFLQHNAFRAPGAPSGDELEAAPWKVDYFTAIYSKMRRGIAPHACFVGGDNMHLLDGADFVFLCFDNGPAKRVIVEGLIKGDVPFVDVGMGLEVVEGCVSGLLRVTASTPDHSEHAAGGKRIPFAEAEDGDEYSTNIQVADLNALNAALAVIKWKKVFGFYLDLEREHHTTYSINGNEITNEESRLP